MVATALPVPSSILQRTCDRLADWTIAVAALALLALVLVQGWQVIARYVLNDSPSWTEPVTLLMLSTAMSMGAAAGVHTLVEKPIAETVEAGQRMVEAFASAGLVGAVGHIERFNPALQQLRRRLEAGDLGNVFQIATRRQGPFPARIADVGVAKDLASHDVDGSPVGDRAEEGPQRAAGRVEAVRVLPEEDEDLLGDLLGRGGGTGDPLREAEDESGVAVEDQAEGRLVAGDDARDEDRVIRRGRRAHPRLGARPRHGANGTARAAPDAPQDRASRLSVRAAGVLD